MLLPNLTQRAPWSEADADALAQFLSTERGERFLAALLSRIPTGRPPGKTSDEHLGFIAGCEFVFRTVTDLSSVERGVAEYVSAANQALAELDAPATADPS